jgi:hypothetical protein
MKYYDPNTLVKQKVTFTHTNRSGFGFGINPDDEAVFIPTNFVRDLALQVGDGLTAICTDNYAKEETKNFSSRWRAVQVMVDTRAPDMLAATEPRAVGIATTVTVEPTDFVGVIDKLMDEQRPWTTNGLAQAACVASPPLMALPELMQKITGRLTTQHRNGEIACVKVYAKGDQERASAVYFAKNVDVFYEHLDTPINE